MPIRYRTFRNPDPPALVRIWNESFTARGAAYLQGATPLEHYVFAKPYFDPSGLILAVGDDGTPVAFVHSGFGADVTGRKLAYERGVICALAVQPNHRRRGIGAELLHRAEDYLRQKGAREIHFGSARRGQPFYWGMYGGSEPAGVLTSDSLAKPFLVKNGYEAAQSVVVLQRSLDQEITAADARFPAIRRRTETRILPRPSTADWFEESQIGPLEMLSFQLFDNNEQTVVAQARVWDMDLFGWRWHHPAAGIVDLDVASSRRRQGLAKFLLVQALRHLQDQFFTLAEAHTPSENVAALRLLEGLGFRRVDEGRVYRLADGTSPDRKGEFLQSEPLPYGPYGRG